MNQQNNQINIENQEENEKIQDNTLFCMKSTQFLIYSLEFYTMKIQQHQKQVQKIEETKAKIEKENQKNLKILQNLKYLKNKDPQFQFNAYTYFFKNGEMENDPKFQQIYSEIIQERLKNPEKIKKNLNFNQQIQQQSPIKCQQKSKTPEKMKIKSDAKEIIQKSSKETTIVKKKAQVTNSDKQIYNNTTNTKNKNKFSHYPQLEQNEDRKINNFDFMGLLQQSGKKQFKENFQNQNEFYSNQYNSDNDSQQNIYQNENQNNNEIPEKLDENITAEMFSYIDLEEVKPQMSSKYIKQDFEQNDDRYLVVKKGEIVQCLPETIDKWVLCYKNGQFGYLPQNYLL
ncbi:Src homology-3 domain [Pseudocohnilembus persalinus]|uniref:Src homology-3 domain n=1 Tax=Pseudocohnilembus persalinus TaxID=266149 RepID=A0A0V0QR02_PSEPJ|nr:Src homology-3 domain [Pseudocohnilembus persalinus]|eukprot:KRX04719.1 Src homology-3 domain [Pseudocohnilembus persalinus]